MEDQRKLRRHSTGHDDNEIIELTQEMKLADQNGATIIELTEVVDDPGASASESVESLLAMRVERSQEEILELTDIVDFAESEAATARLNDDQLIELTEIVDPVVIDRTPVFENGDQEILELTDIVDQVAVGPEIAVGEETLGHESAEIADLFLEAMAAAKSASGEKKRSALERRDADEEQEQVIQLTDVLGQAGEYEKALPSGRIEEVLEHLLQTKFTVTLNRLIVDAVEKAVARKTEDLKRSVRDGDDSR